MLRNESGDIMQELERKMQMLIDSHEREKTELESDHKSALSSQASEAERRL